MSVHYNTRIFVALDGKSKKVAQLNMSYIPAKGDSINVRAFILEKRFTGELEENLFHRLMTTHILRVIHVNVVYKQDVEEFFITTEMVGM